MGAKRSTSLFAVAIIAGLVSDLKHNINLRPLIYIQAQVVANELLETGHRGGERIATRSQVGQDEVTENIADS